MQVDGLRAINGDSDLPESVLTWFLGTHLVQTQSEAASWVRVLQRYRDEWIGLATRYRNQGLIWPQWLV